MSSSLFISPHYFYIIFSLSKINNNNFLFLHLSSFHSHGNNPLIALNTKQHHPQNKFHRQRLSTFPLHLFYSFFTKKKKNHNKTRSARDLLTHKIHNNSHLQNPKPQRPPNLTTATHTTKSAPPRRNHHPRDKITTLATRPPPP